MAPFSDARFPAAAASPSSFSSSSGREQFPRFVR